jgi:hypothetical protein
MKERADPRRVVTTMVPRSLAPETCCIRLIMTDFLTR